MAGQVVWASVGAPDPYLPGLVVELEAPVSFVDHAVMELAEQDQVGQAGQPAPGPEEDVMGVAPAGWP